MPVEVVEEMSRFIAEHHVERPFVKRRRQPADLALASCGYGNGRRI
jgi:hypothetical protein